MEVGVIVDVSPDIRAKVGLAWASDIRWIQITESIEVEVVLTITVVIVGGELINVEF